MIKKALQGIAIGLPVIAASLLVTAPVASADINDCPDAVPGGGYLCAWTEDNFTGGLAYWGQGENDASWLDHGMHDDADSLINNVYSSQSVVDNVQIYEDVDYGTFDICVNPGETYDAGMDDNDYDSHQWVHGC